MYQHKKVGVVVPAYNESTQIETVVATMPDYVDAIVITDDCSTDDTVAVIEALKEKYARIVLLRHEKNEGVGGAIATGYEWCRDNDMDVAVVMAGDGQMDPGDMPDLLDPVVNDDIDYSKGNRLIYQRSFEIIPPVRFFGNSVLSLLTKIASGYWHVADSQTGYTAIGRRPLNVIDWQTLYKRYGQPNDLLVKLNVHNFRVRDIPIRPVYNVGEKSGIQVEKVAFTISWLLLNCFLWRLKEKYIIRDFHPLVFFYGFGLVLLALCFILVPRLVYLTALYGWVPPMTTMAMLFCFAMGAQFILFAMLFDMQANQHLR